MGVQSRGAEPAPRRPGSLPHSAALQDESGRRRPEAGALWALRPSLLLPRPVHAAGTEAQRGEGPARPRSREAPARLHALIHMDEGPGLHAGRPLAASTPPRAAEHLLALEGCRSSTLERNPPWCMAGSAQIKDRKKENEAFLVKTEARSSCDIRASGGLRQRRGGAKARGVPRGAPQRGARELRGPLRAAGWGEGSWGAGTQTGAPATQGASLGCPVPQFPT